MSALGTRRTDRGQGGQSLVELIIVILMLSTVFLVIIGGLFTINRASETNERIQTVDAALIAYGEILRTQVPYAQCAGGFEEEAVAQQYQTAAEAYITGNTGPGAGAVEAWLRPPAMEVVITAGVDSWDLAEREFVSGCVFPDSGIQRVSYSATFRQKNADGDWEAVATREGQVVKRKAGPS
jgi:type II secretory pathway pseudopilin PulG